MALLTTTAAMQQALRGEPRVEFLRRLADLPLTVVLRRPWLHVLCDAPMETFLRSGGLPPDRMTQALEHGAFLSGSFALPCPARSAIVVATRRSEEAVVGVLRTRGIRALPLFAALLPRLASHSPVGLTGAQVNGMPDPGRLLGFVGLPWSGADLVAGAVGRMTNVAAVDAVGPAQIAMAEVREISGFDPRLWWRRVTRANAVGGRFAAVLQWPAVETFLSHLEAAERDWLEGRLSRFRMVRLRRDPLVIAAAEEARAAVARPAPRDAAVAAILRRRDALRDSEARLDAWLASVGAAVTTVDCDAFCAEPGATARRLAEAAGFPAADQPSDAAPLVPPRPAGPRFDRFLAAARAACAVPEAGRMTRSRDAPWPSPASRGA